MKKLGPNAYPFYFELPPHCPASVTLQPVPGDTGKPCGVDYELKAFVGDSQEDKPHKRYWYSFGFFFFLIFCQVFFNSQISFCFLSRRNSVRLAIRKIMYAPSKQGEQPSIEVSKEFVMSPNKLHLEASLDKEVINFIYLFIYFANTLTKMYRVS